MSEATTSAREVNGVDVDALFETINAVKEAPVLAKFRFRAGNQWQGGGLNRTTISNFHGTSQELQHKKPFILVADEPPLLLGEDRGPNPVEYLLTGLAACVTTALVYHAAAKGIEIEELEAQVEGDIDLQGFLGIDDNVPRGYQNIRMKYKVKANAPREQLEEILQLGPTYSPVFDTVTRAVPVTVELDD